MHYLQEQSNITLKQLHEIYEAVLALTSQAEALLADHTLLRPLKEEFCKVGFVQIAGIVNPEPLTMLMETLIPILSPLAGEVVLLHEEKTTDVLSDGHHFRRVDPDGIQVADVRRDMMLLFDHLGLTDFGSRLATRVTPIVHRIVGPLSYRVLCFNFYNEGDYISAHNDRHRGERVNIQFPISLGTVCGIRVLSDGLFKTHYDVPGSMNILGARVWHDVPPLLMTTAGVTPKRGTLSLKFMPDKEDEATSND